MTDLIERATKAIDLFDSICNIHDPSVSAHDRRVRAMAKVLGAAPSPSPAPGVVEALREAAETLEWASRRMKGNCSGSDVNAVILAASRARKASLSQPAKGEREGGGL